MIEMRTCAATELLVAAPTEEGEQRPGGLAGNGSGARIIEMPEVAEGRGTEGTQPRSRIHEHDA